MNKHSGSSKNERPTSAFAKFEKKPAKPSNKGAGAKKAGAAKKTASSKERGKRLSDKQQVKRKNNRSEARAASSGERLCRVSGTCGGCQHIEDAYAKQLEAKQRYMEKLFADVELDAPVLPILGMDEPFHYRNKVVSPYAPGKKRPGGAGKAKSGGAKDAKASGKARRGLGYVVLTGMYAAHSHRLVPTDTCLLENETAKEVTLAVRDIMMKYGVEPYREDEGAGFMRHAVVRVGHNSGEVLVTLVTNEREFPSSKAFCKELVRRCPAVTTIVQNVNTRQTNVILGDEEHTLYGPGFILDTLCGLSFRISSKSFYQVNSTQTEVLYRTAVELANAGSVSVAIDAYCGTGTIGLVAAKMGAARVIGVDSVASAIRDAQQNAAHNGIDNAAFVAQDASAFMRAFARDAEEAAQDEGDIVLFMDPPRAGSTPEFIDAAAVLAPNRIVYISCNPETQVRDILLFEQKGYRVSAVRPVDMFPHTEHVESVALLTRGA